MPPKPKMTRANNYANVVVNIDYVENGLACNCTCICCGARVVAKQGELQGKKQANHFAHKSGEPQASSCTWSYETDLHIIAKEVLATTQELSVTLHGPIPKTMHMIFDSVLTETTLSNTDSKLRPDLTALFGEEPITSPYAGETVYIEIAVTHKCEKDKLQEFRKLNLNVIEIDLQNFEMTGDTVKFGDVERYIANEADKKWISIKPAGYIGSLVNEQARTALRDLVRDQAKELQSIGKIKYELAQWEKQRNHKMKQLNKLKEELILSEDELREHKRSIDNLAEDFSRNRHRLRSELEAKFRSDNQNTQEKYNNLVQEIECLNQEISNLYDKRAIESERARREIPNVIQSNHELAQQVFNDKYSELKQELYNTIREENFDLSLQKKTKQSQLNSTLDDINKAELRLEKLNAKCAHLREFEAYLDRKERSIKTIELEIQDRSRLYTQASRHLKRLFPELRDIARKHGIPWPFADNLIDELQKTAPELEAQ